MPVIVLSNNDGCAIARSEEAKALHIKMGDPLFKIRDVIKRHGIEVRSSNYELYADMNRRFNAVIAEHSDLIEIYSIDESFYRLPVLANGLGDVAAAHRLRAAILRADRASDADRSWPDAGIVEGRERLGEGDREDLGRCRGSPRHRAARAALRRVAGQGGVGDRVGAGGATCTRLASGRPPIWWRCHQRPRGMSARSFSSAWCAS